MSTQGQIGYLTQLLAVMRQQQTLTPTPAPDADLISLNIQPYDADLLAIAGLTGATGLLRKTGLNTWILDTNGYLTSINSSQVTTALGYTPVTNARTLTINGVSYDLTADRSWTIAAGVTSFNTRTGAITLSSTDVTGALGFTPYNATNPSGYISSYTETDPTVGSHIKAITTTNISNWNTAYGWGNHALAGYLTGITSGQVTTALGFTPENAGNKGVANGYASLDGSGLVPSTQLPSYVDDVLEYTNLAAFPATGTTGKIYIDLATNKVYRWSGTVYIEVSPTVGTIWGGITGTLANQTDLQNALDAKVPTSRTLTINGTSFDLTANRSWTINSMVYPGAGIAVSTGSAWGTSITDNSTNWNTAYSSRISSLTVTGSSGAATLVSNVLNIPTYTLVGLGGQASSTNLTSLSGLTYASASFVKMTAAGTFSLDTNTYLTSFTETDPTVGSHIKAITTTQISNWDSAYTQRLQWDGGATNLVAATGRTSLGATTVGGNLFTLVNPTAVTFIRVNADNTVSTLDAATFRTAIGAGTSSTTGTVTSVSGTGTVSGLSISGTVTTTGNITLSGILAVTASNFSSQTANTFLAAPNGTAGVPTFRTIVAADIPTLNQSTTGSAGSVANSLILKADTGTTEGSDLYTYNGSTAKTLNIVAGSNITITKTAGQWSISGSAGGTSLNGTGYVKMSGTTPSYVASIPNADLANSSITVQGTSVSLGGSVNVINGTGFVKASGTTISYDNSSYSLTSHTHYIGTTQVQASSANQALTGISGITFVAEGSDAASIATTISSTSTFFDFNLTDDNNNDEWRWRFTPSGATVYNAMRLVPVSNTASNLIVSGTITGSQIIRSGGTSSQFLKADGSVDSSSYYLASNPSGYTTNTGTVTSVSGTGGYGGLTLSGTVTTSGSLTLGGTPTGTWPISVSGNAATLTGFTTQAGARYTTNFNSILTTGFYNAEGTPTNSPGGSYGQLIVAQGIDTGLQIYGGYANDNLWFRGWHSSGTFYTWRTVLHDGNYNSYAPKLDGTGATGTWGISISGNAATATSSTTAGALTSMNISQFTNNSGYITGISFANVSSKPTTLSGYGITDAISTSSGIISGTLTVQGGGVNGVTVGLYARDVTAARTTTTGVIYLGSDGNHYVYFDGTNYIMPSGNLTLNGSTVWTAGNLTNLNQLTNGPGYITGITSGNVTTALGYTPVTNARTLSINGTAYDLTADRSWTISAGTTLNGTGFVKASGTTISYDNSTYLTSAVTSVGGTGSYGGLTLTGTVTTTGNLTLGGTPTGTWPISVSGSAASASSAVTLSTTKANWNTNGTITAVVGQLSWKNYGNSHTIFDASAGTSPDGGAVNNTNSQVAWTGTYPTLMGWNGTYTYGVRVDTARYADSAGSASSASTSSQVTVNYNNDSNSTYQMLWGSGNSVYGTGGIYCNPASDTLYATLFVENSSIRFKENIITLEDSLDKVVQMRGVKYNKKGTNYNQVGVIAEEVLDILPEVVNYSPTGEIEGVAYARLTAVLIEAVKEQQKQIDELKNLLNSK